MPNYWYICSVMSNKEILSTIKFTVHRFLPDARVLLFGSRARGDFNKQSDFDVLVITKDTFPPKDKREWTGKIGSSLVNILHAPFDIICHSEEEVNAYKNYYGHIVRYALKDAVEL